MEQLYFFNTQEKELWEKIHGLEKCIRGLFARYNSLEKEMIDIQRDRLDRAEKSNFN